MENNEKENNEFWLKIWTLIVMVVFVITIATTIYHTHRNVVIRDLIKSGVPAIEAGCAIEDDYYKNPKCIVLATKATK